jgi:hypothetical protein
MKKDFLLIAYYFNAYNRFQLKTKTYFCDAGGAKTNLLFIIP